MEVRNVEQTTQSKKDKEIGKNKERQVQEDTKNEKLQKQQNKPININGRRTQYHDVRSEEVQLYFLG
jgi:hypothetical protein